MPKVIPKDASFADIAPTLKAGAVYVAEVRQRMIQLQKAHGVAVVARIGVMGQGIIPNFRIDTEDGQPIAAYDGQSYTPFGELNTHDANWSSASMTFEEVTNLVAKMRGFKVKSA